jgi:drug/metabolite transporter (DMT)-like permease
MNPRRDYQLGLLYVTISAFAWSLAGYFTRLIPLDSFTLLAWRGIFGAASLLLVVILFRGRTGGGNSPGSASRNSPISR